MPGEHHAQHSEGVEEHHGEHGGKARRAERGEVQCVEERGGDTREGEGEHDRRDHAHKPREVVRRIQRLAPHGHGVEALRRAGRGEVREHRHGEEDAEYCRHREAAVGADAEHIVGYFLGDVPARVRDPARVRKLIEQRQRQDQQPEERVAEPQRPKALQVSAEKGAVKERCHGLHSRHLPAHR